MGRGAWAVGAGEAIEGEYDVVDSSEEVDGDGEGSVNCVNGRGGEGARALGSGACFRGRFFFE